MILGDLLAFLISIFTARRVCVARTMPWQDVCPSVCPYVCLSHAGIESKRLYISSKFFHYRVASLVFQYQTGRQYSDGEPLTEASNARGYETAPKLSNGTGFNDLEWPSVTFNPDFKVMISFNVNELKKRYQIELFTMADQ